MNVLGHQNRANAKKQKTLKSKEVAVYRTIIAAALCLTVSEERTEASYNF
jgi:hypothetical protein